MFRSRARFLATVVFAAGLGSASGANATQIILNNVGGVEVGTNAYVGFTKAAQYWSAILTNNVTINLNVGYSSLGPGILGSASSTQFGVSNIGVETLMGLRANSALDAMAVANLPTLDGGGNLDVITSGYANPATKFGVNTSVQVFDNDDSGNNRGLAINSANAKALGFGGIPVGTVDATIRFSSDFAFDFDPTNGIGDNSYDFIGIAIHEIGHALGFVSGVDTYDVLGSPNGPGAPFNDNVGRFVVNSPLDYFRYSTDPNNIAPGAGPALDWSVGGTPYFSVDRGASVFTIGGRQGYFSTGQFNGDGRQASHWKDNTYAGGSTCSNPITEPKGILDPTSGRCEGLAVTALDLAAFDVIGWNLSVDVLANPRYVARTSAIYRGVYSGAIPEPASWALMILGFGAVGATVRRRRTGLA